MAKTRNCRRTDEERYVHEQAVALRKMTDTQLVEAFETRYRDGHTDGRIAGYEKGYIYGKIGGGSHGFKETANTVVTAEQLIEKLEKTKGYGAIKLGRIRTVLERMKAEGGNGSLS